VAKCGWKRGHGATGGADKRRGCRHLADGDPRVLGLSPLAGAALLVAEDVLHHEGLLQHRARHHLLLHRQLELDATRVRLGPNIRGVDEPDLRQPARLLEQQREELLGLHVHLRPAAVPPLEPVAAAARVLLDLLRYSCADVVALLETVDAHIDRVRLDHDGALAAEDLVWLVQDHGHGCGLGQGRERAAIFAGWQQLLRASSAVKK